jgi:hypothetical protein
VLLASKTSQHKGGGGGKGVPAAATNAAVTSLAVRRRFSAREMKFCQVISDRNADPQFIGSSISSGSKVEALLLYQYQQQFYL